MPLCAGNPYADAAVAAAADAAVAAVGEILYCPFVRGTHMAEKEWV